MRNLRLILFCGLAAILSHYAYADSSIDVLTFNIRYDSGNGQPSNRNDAWTSTARQHRRELVLKLIDQADPDLLCVQEALVNQIDDLRARLSNHGFYGVGRDDGKQAGEYCGIFFRRDRFAQSAVGTFWLNEKSDEAGSKFPQTCCARIATWITLADRRNNGREFVFLNTHWDHQIQAAREYSAALIQEKLPALAKGRAVIVAGDLNATPENPAFANLLKLNSGTGIPLADCYRVANPEVSPDEATFNGFRGITEGARIDYVLCSKQFRAVSSEIIRTHESRRYPSDHYPVAARLEWLAQ